MDIKEQIKPFIYVEHDGGTASVILNVGVYKQDVFDTRADEGFEGGGYDWASLAQVYLEEKEPEMHNKVAFDPEASMFCAYSMDREALQQFILGFKAACEDDGVIKDLFSRARLD